MKLKHRFMNYREDILTFLELNRLKLFPIMTYIAFQIWFIISKAYKSQVFSSLQKQDLHFNVLSTNAILAGFLFTGLGILIGASNKKIIMILNKGKYLKTIHNSILYGIYSHIIAIFISFITMINSFPKAQPVLVNFEFSLMIIGITYFIMGIWEIGQIIEHIRNDELDGEKEAVTDDEDDELELIE